MKAKQTIIIMLFSIILAENNCIDLCLKNHYDRDYCERKCRALLMDADDSYLNSEKNRHSNKTVEEKNKVNTPNYNPDSRPLNIRKKPY